MTKFTQTYPTDLQSIEWLLLGLPRVPTKPEEFALVGHKHKRHSAPRPNRSTAPNLNLFLACDGKPCFCDLVLSDITTLGFKSHV